MLLRTPDLFSISNLVDIDPVNNANFRDHEQPELTGRCLLDTLEYLKAVPQFSGQFRQVTNAHAIRLACSCLSDTELDRRQVRDRMETRILETCRQLRKARNSKPPFYGDDFWDWAIVIESLVEVQSRFPNVAIGDDVVIDDSIIVSELTAFYESVEAKIDGGLTAPESKAEWYGPATAVVAHRLLIKQKTLINRNLDDVIAKLRTQALQPIVNERYRGRMVVPYHILWHYGQVVAEFPKAETKLQAEAIAGFFGLTAEETPDAADRVYALARILQGALKVSDQTTIDEALKRLYELESADRPLGQGIMGENVKGSLNVLEALWPNVQSGRKSRIRKMIDTLSQAHVSANTVGIIVAIDHEAEAAKQAFREQGATISEKDANTTVVKHANYRAVVRQGKALLGVDDVTHKVIDKDQARWLIMFGIAGSLGSFVKTKSKKSKRSKTSLFRGPDIGHVVTATSLAPFHLYDKAREKTVNAKVPYRGSTWMIIPTDPTLFALAHRAGEKLFEPSGRFHEGLIVTGTGVKDGIKVKDEILSEFPGGLAVETEGYAVALTAVHSGIPCLVIRGISDRALGDKEKQGKNPQQEKNEQFCAAFAAAQLTVRVVELLSQRW